MMKIAIGSDHRGFALKKILLAVLEGITLVDCGAASDERSDYPDFAHAVAQMILDKKAEAGILLCGTGIGMAMAANRNKGIYAGVCWNAEVACKAKADDHLNVLVLPADYISQADAIEIVAAWLDTEPLGERHAERLAKIDCESVQK